MKKIMTIAALSLAFSTACNKDEKVVTDLAIELGNNTVGLSADFSDQFALDLSGVFDLAINGKDYGDVFLYGASNSTPFTAGITLDIEAFKPATWDGFGPTTKLPNGQPLPTWITPYELIAVDIPINNANFSLKAYVGIKDPYYLGTAVGLKFLNDAFPEGLSLSQVFRKDGAIWSGVVAYGPTRNDAGEVTHHGGLFILGKYDPALGQSLYLGQDLMAGEWRAEGKNADYYNHNPKEMRKILKQVQKAIKQFNDEQAAELQSL